MSKIQLMVAIFFLALLCPTDATLWHQLNRPATALAQEKVRAVEPLRVTVLALDEDSQAIDQAVKQELRKWRNVVITSKDADYGMQLAGKAVTVGKCTGVFVAVFTTDANGHKSIQGFAGDTWEGVAKFLVDQFKEDLENTIAKKEKD